jgi:sterol desaturase/sphingolipid hydroxylase (fatty acid hydroxylase superfamily)
MNRILLSVSKLPKRSAPCDARRLQISKGSPGAVRVVLAIFMVDFMIYWIHRAQHRFEALWRTHAWHHSIEQLYWFSGFRTSFLHSFIYNVPQAAVPMLVFNLSPLEAGVGYSIGLLIQFWEHTNLDVRIGPLKYLIIAAYHRVHQRLHTADVLNNPFALLGLAVWHLR